MNCIKLLLLTISLLWTTLLNAINVQIRNKINISGFVYNTVTNIPISNVSLFSKKQHIVAESDSTGYFNIDLPAGDIKLEVNEISHFNYTLTLTDIKTDTTVTIYLREKIHQLEEVTVTANPIQNNVRSPNMGKVSMNQQTIKTIPALFGEVDIIKAFQTQPGVSGGTEGMAGMYVRGGNGDENLYMIEGHPIYQVNHLGGLFSAFNAEAIRSVDFYKSAFPARYGGRLSSVLDVHLKNGNTENYHGCGSIGLTSGNLNLEGPLIKGRTSFNISLRRSWLDVLSAPTLLIMNGLKEEDEPKTIASYAFTDLNVKINHRINEKNNAYTLLYLGDDRLKIGEKEHSVNNEESYKRKDISPLRWGNVLVAAGWSYRPNKNILTELSTSYTRYASTLKRKLKEEWSSQEMGKVTKKHINKSTENFVEDVMLQAKFNYEHHKELIIKGGANYSFHHFRPEYNKSITTTGSSIHSSGILSAQSQSAYLEGEWEPFSPLSVHAGLRFSSFTIQNKTKTSLEPRISTRLMLLSNLSFKMSYSKMRQYVQQMSNNYISLPTDLWMPITAEGSPMESNQYAAGIYYNLNSVYSFSLEGYYKEMDHILEYKEGSIFLPSTTPWNEKLTTGKGRSYGIEWIGRKKTGKVTGWIGYGLIWSDRLFPELNKGLRFPSKYDNRHKVNIVVNWKLKKNIELNSSWTYMTGNRITLSLENYQGLDMSGFPADYAPLDPYENPFGLGFYEKKNNVRLPAYHRLDIGINFYRMLKKGKTAIWTISLYNAYSRMNPIVIQKESLYAMDNNQVVFDKWNSRFKTFSIFPIIPSISYTYKF